MAKLIYRRTIVGYHGCDLAIARAVLAGDSQLKASANPYDWLGRGIYFWEHGPRRAYEWAVEQAQLSGRKVSQPAVLGAQIDLGLCLDLLDTANTLLLMEWYCTFRRLMNQSGVQLPRNQDAPGGRRGEKVLRFLDRAVIDFTVSGLAETQGAKYQTVRGVFIEGPPAFPGAKIARKSHIQIAVRDRACIRELFKPDLAHY